MTDGIDRHCPDHEEPANLWSHGLGAVAAVVAALLMVWVASERWDDGRLAGAGVHGGFLVALFVTSAVYHGLPRGSWKDRLQTVDHAVIYGFIASVHTLFALTVMKGLLAAALLGLQWGLAAIGVALKVAYGPMQLRNLSLGLYLVMGTMIVPFGLPIVEVLPFAANALVLVGGLSYLVGLVFYLAERIPYNHFLWHLFVLVGAGCHAVAAIGWVLPPP